MREVAAGPRKQLEAGRDIHVIACRRAAGGPQTGSHAVTTHVAGAKTHVPRAALGVRWGSRPDLGFPHHGYRLSIVAPDELDDEGQPARQEVGTFFLPASDSWASFEADANAREPAAGPYFPAIDEHTLGFLLPLVRLADPRTASKELPGLAKQASEFFGHTHAGDAELAWRFWRHAEPPGIDDLLSDPTSAAAIVGYYRQHTTDFLLVLALRFEYAALLGLGADIPAPNVPVVAEIEGSWTSAYGVSTSDRTRTNAACALSPPGWLNAERAPGTVAHPAFAAWPDWEPPADMAPVDSQGRPMPAAATIPRSPAAFTALTWPDETLRQTVVDYGPVLYRLGRHDHGAATAGDPAAPPLPANPSFDEVVDGEAIVRGEGDPQYLDLPGMPWPPLEGHYHYALFAVDLLGTPSSGYASATIRHHDDISPSRPRAVSEEGQVSTIPAGKTDVTVPLRIDWDAGEDFAGPDVVEFRVAAQWTPLTAIPVQVSTGVSVDALHAELTVASLPGSADQYKGLRLTMSGAEYPIVSHGTGAGAKVRIVKVSGGWPSPGSHGVIFSGGATTQPTRVAKTDRRPAVPAAPVKVPSLDPLELVLDASGSEPLPADDTARIYLHLLRASFDAEQSGGSWTITAPEEGQPGYDAWQKWQGMADPEQALLDSPAIVFPPHSVSVSATAPAGWVAGILTLLVTAADDASYVESPSLPVADAALAAPKGNESARSEVIVSVRSLNPPATPTVPAWDPSKRTWARSAANYAEAATHDLSWGASGGAVRYEVWRALEGALSGATPATSDAQLRSLAAAQDDAFDLRSDRIFSTAYRDELPGRAPTRALYRVRAVGAGGVVSPPSAIIGPVHVPDVRQPPAPNLVRAVAATASEPDRAIAVEWTQSGPVEGVRFDVQFREAGSSEEFAPAGSLATGSAPGSAGRYRFLHLERVPGRQYEYRVLAVREALDPIDPTGQAKRDVRSRLSAVRAGAAISRSPLQPPVSLAAAIVGTDDVKLTWQNRDPYEAVEVWRRGDGQYVHQRVGEAGGDATEYTDASATSGTWHYQLRARGIRREARSAVEAQAIVP